MDILKEIKCANELSLIDCSKLAIEINENSKFGDIRRIIKIVCNYFNVSLLDFYSKKRNRIIVQSRQISMYFSRELNKYSLSIIGNNIGNLDHCTILFGIKQVNNLIQVDSNFRNHIINIEKLLL